VPAFLGLAFVGVAFFFGLAFAGAFFFLAISTLPFWLRIAYGGGSRWTTRLKSQRTKETDRFLLNEPAVGARVAYKETRHDCWAPNAEQ
jgi:hypothetical protein